MSKLRIEDVSYAYAQEDVLKNMNLTIEEGEFLCILGHSGCGKSTLLHLLAGLIKPRKGQILKDGKPLTGPGTDRGVVFQNYSLFPWMTVEKNVIFAVEKTGRFTKEKSRQRAHEFLTRTEMEEHKKKYPYQLSGGMRQRTAIARALAMDADILLLDEPFGALDTKIRAELQRLLKDLWSRGEKKTVIFVTHDLEEAMILASRIVFIRDGMIKESIPIPEDINRCCRDCLDQEACRELKNTLTRLYV
ncbi:MAG: ABC transporter ATP-binding protein [Lachnospiraceae bacterium]